VDRIAPVVDVSAWMCSAVLYGLVQKNMQGHYQSANLLQRRRDACMIHLSDVVIISVVVLHLA